jgi:hypothetical protein
MKPKIIQAEGPNDQKRPILMHGCTVYPLKYVYEKKYYEEGFSKPDEFKDIWLKMPGHPWDLKMNVCFLEFKKMIQKT